MFSELAVDRYPDTRIMEAPCHEVQGGRNEVPLSRREGVHVRFIGVGPRPFVVIGGSRTGFHFNDREAHRDAAVLRQRGADNAAAIEWYTSL